MKKHISTLLAVLIVLPFFCSCLPFEDIPDEDWDTSLLIGKWQQEGTQIYYRYNSNGTGCTWDEADDVYESEAQSFSWEVDGSEMIHIHYTETGTAEVPKYYIITSLNSFEMRYYDAYVTSKKYTFTKVR